MSATNVARDTSAADYLNWLRLSNQQQQAAGTAGTNFTPEYIFQFSDIVDITDSLSLGSVLSLSDSFDITDLLSITTTGQYKIGTAQIGFCSMG